MGVGERVYKCVCVCVCACVFLSVSTRIPVLSMPPEGLLRWGRGKREAFLLPASPPGSITKPEANCSKTDTRSALRNASR